MAESNAGVEPRREQAKAPETHCGSLQVGRAVTSQDCGIVVTTLPAGSTSRPTMEGAPASSTAAVPDMQPETEPEGSRF